MIFEYENPLYHPITLPMCDHTMCGRCIREIRNKTKCTQDQVSFGINHTSIDELPINYPFLIILYDPSQLPEHKKERYGQCPSYMKLDNDTKLFFNCIETGFGEISLMIKPIIVQASQSIFSRSMIRELFSLLNSQRIDPEGRLQVLKVARSLGEHICVDYIIRRQKLEPQQLKQKLVPVIGPKGVEILEAGVLESIVKVLPRKPVSSYKVLVLSVLQDVGVDKPAEFKPFVDHIVDLLCRASCFEERQDSSSSSIDLKPEFKNYASLRNAFNYQIIQMAMSNGLRTSPGEWSSLFYGHTEHESSMESVIDELSTSDSFLQAIQELLTILQDAGGSSEHLSSLKSDFPCLLQIDLRSNDQQILSLGNEQDNSSWSLILKVLQSVKAVLQSSIQLLARIENKLF